MKGASNGEGLGNAFLSHIRAVDGIFQVVRIFDEAHITHVEGDIDPIRDLEIIANELRLKDLQFLETQISKLESLTKHQDKTKLKELQVAVDCSEWIKQGKDIRSGDWKAVDVCFPKNLLIRCNTTNLFPFFFVFRFQSSTLSLC